MKPLARTTRDQLIHHQAWRHALTWGHPANLRGAYLSGANLRGAYLRGAYLGGAYLGGAYLGGANLGGAYLSGANLRDANLSDAIVTADGQTLTKYMEWLPTLRVDSDDAAAPSPHHPAQRPDEEDR